ncbi:MAG: HU family DNA-binding protein [Syntrophorhabdus sp.]|jgi:DNA-binding protein HU-beta|nr:HU family DNA-binding protein [Pseudomonadota bacterium]
MNKSGLIRLIASRSNISKTSAEHVTNAILEVISAALSAGDKVQLTGFGSFEVSNISSRDVRNPQTGVTIRVNASKKVRFKPGKHLKSAINAK